MSTISTERIGDIFRVCLHGTSGDLWVAGRVPEEVPDADIHMTLQGQTLWVAPRPRNEREAKQPRLAWEAWDLSDVWEDLPGLHPWMGGPPPTRITFVDDDDKPTRVVEVEAGPSDGFGVYDGPGQIYPRMVDAED